MAGKTSKTAKASMGEKGEHKKRLLNGKEVRPVRYIGHAVGHGTFMAGTVDGTLVVDENGVPLPFRRIGALA